MRILVPAYCYPEPQSEYWSTLLKPETSDLDVILNPSSGPGQEIDEQYRNLARKLRKRDIPIFGYIATAWGEKPMETIQNEISLWENFYDVTDIFFDEAPSSNSSGFYDTVYEKIGGRAIFNPGCDYVNEKPSPMPWQVVTAECTYEYYTKTEFPDSKGSSLAHIVYGVQTQEAMRRVVQIAKGYAESVFVTDERTLPKYNRLPSYWQALKQEVKCI